MGDLRVNLCGIALDNPIIPASGTFGYGYEFAELYDINVLGTFSFKGTTKNARFGNVTPRVVKKLWPMSADSRLRIMHIPVNGFQHVNRLDGWRLTSVVRTCTVVA